jgi:branched-chain amino acid transport system permease protein
VTDYIQFAVVGLALGSIYALVALGFHLTFRATGVLDFAQGEKVLLGGLVALSINDWGVPLGMASVLAVGAGLVAGIVYCLLVIAPTFRKPGFAPIVATVGAALVFFYGQQLVWGPEARPFPSFPGDDVEIGSVLIRAEYFWIWGALALVLLVLAWFFNRTREGQAMTAAATDPIAASLVGIDVWRTRFYAFSISFGLAILAGILIAPITLAGGTSGLTLMLKAFAGAMLGGITSPVGVVIGALLVGLLDTEIAGIWEFGYRDPAVFSILLLVLLLRPRGLLGEPPEKVG